MNDLISRQAAINVLWKALYDYEDKTEKQFQESDELDVADWLLHRIFVQNMSDIDRKTILNLPSAQPDEKLEKCRFEYIHACRIATYPTPDTTKKDISDAYAVIKALQPIFGDVPFAKVKRGGKDGTD